MKRESGQAFAEFLLFVMVILLVVLVVSFVVRLSDTAKFDQKFDSGQISIENNQFRLGEQGHPLGIKYNGQIPGAGSTERRPRVISVSDCDGITLYKDTVVVHAATTFPSPDLITVQMPLLASGKLNVCVPQGSKIDVILWESPNLP
ncbi:MAG TPA: hypothetical protein VF837_00545 [Patescibacteria group bacterium]